MATPKIKLYRLPTGYSSLNDNDIQNATNDQLLPVSLKKVMPNQAYQLVGVQKKTNQALIPVVNCVLTQDVAICANIANTTKFYFPVILRYNKQIVSHKLQLLPRFYYYTQDTPTSKKFFIPKVEYIIINYIDETTVQSLFTNNANLKFVIYYTNSDGWILHFRSNVFSSYADINIYVNNYYNYCITSSSKTLSILNSTDIYDFVKNEFFSSTSSGYIDNSIDGIYDKSIPFIQEATPKYFNVQLISSSINVINDCTITSDYKLTEFKFANGQQEKSVELKYYFIDDLNTAIEKCSSFSSNSNFSSVDLYFSTYHDYVYNGTSNAKYPNKMFLQTVKVADINNVVFNSTNSDINNINVVKNSHDYRQTVFKESYDLNRGLLKNKIIYDANLSSFNKFNIRSVDQSDEGIIKPDYLLDAEKGIFSFSSMPTSSLNTYFFSTYYYQSGIAKLFVSDHQNWVSQHLRNNPDVFYGKYDYAGDDYIDANGDTIQTGMIPKYLQNGQDHTIQYRNGAILFGTPRQDVLFTGKNQSNIRTEEGIIYGGAVRANYAYYNGIESVQMQKLQLDSSYNGIGYRYQSINDCSYPQSVGKRWVTRNNTSQFMGTSLITKKLNEQGQLIDQNLPDLKTVQLQELKISGSNVIKHDIKHDDLTGFFIKETIIDNVTNYSFQKYYELNHDKFSFPNFYKINNIVFNETITDISNSVSSNSVLYLTKANTDQLLDYYQDSTTSGKHFVTINQYSYQKDIINFNISDSQTVLSKINVQYDQKYFPIPNLNVIVYFAVELPEDATHIILDKEINIYGTNIVYQQIDGDNQNKKYTLNNDQKNKKYVICCRKISMFKNNFILSENEQNMDNSLQKIQQNNIDEIVYKVPLTYKQCKINSEEIIFSVTNINQLVYFNLKIIDSNSLNTSCLKTIIYMIKKNENIRG